jgi:hypothetical protein
MPNDERAAVTAEYVQATLGPELSREDAEALAAAYAALSSGVARFPSADLHGTEPPLISTPR